ncbi:hypothetical protein [Streptomyces collinus]|uniref:hypothetical protein n=1 Tax=Streptomyces collinus TaxID=42684 RepID=UPI0036E7BBB6
MRAIAAKYQFDLTGGRVRARTPDADLAGGVLQAGDSVASGWRRDSQQWSPLTWTVANGYPISKDRW